VLSIVIPTFNSYQHLQKLLPQISRSYLVNEIVLSDGGSNDNTLEIAQKFKLIKGVANRGSQLVAGAVHASSPWLLFLHSDSSLQPGWDYIVRDFISNPRNIYRSGYFNLIFDASCSEARRIEKIVMWRAKILGLPYGDQGLLISRRYYDHLGGYKCLALMEDVDIVRRIGKMRLVALSSAITTSADRYRDNGWYFRPLKNLFCLALYFIGVPTSILVKLYQ